MKCDQIQPNLLDYSRGLLNPREAESIRAHIERCENCRSMLDAESSLVERLLALPVVELRSDVWSRVQSKLAPSRRRFGIFKIFPADYSRRLAAVAAVVVIVLAVFFSFHRQQVMDEKARVHEAAVLLSVQPASQTTDDPLGPTTDAMLKVLEDESRTE